VTLSHALAAAVASGATLTVNTLGTPLEAGYTACTAAAAAVTGATTISVNNASTLFSVGGLISASGITTHTTVTAISGTTVTLNQALTGNVTSGEAIMVFDITAKQPVTTRPQVVRRLALAYGTHGKPLPYTYTGIPSGTYPLIYFRAVDTSTLPPLPGSGATSNKLLLSFVNFDCLHSNSITVTVTMPRTGTYTGVCYGAGNTIAAAKTTASVVTDGSGHLTFTLTLAPGESTEYILNP
jgi:hypothetical protein